MHLNDKFPPHISAHLDPTVPGGLEHSSLATQSPGLTPQVQQDGFLYHQGGKHQQTLGIHQTKHLVANLLQRGLLCPHR